LPKIHKDSKQDLSFLKRIDLSKQSKNPGDLLKSVQLKTTREGQGRNVINSDFNSNILSLDSSFN